MLRENKDFQKKLNIFERLKVVKAAMTGNQNVINSYMNKFMPQYGEAPRRSTSDWIKHYNLSPRMNPIHQIASDVGCADYSIYGEYDKNNTKKNNHALCKLLKNPNPYPTLTEYVLFYITTIYLLLPTGEAFWLKERNSFGIPTELWPIPPNWVAEIPSKNKNYFTINPSGNISAEIIKVLPNDIVYFKKPDVTNPYLRGIGRSEAIGDELETDEYMAKQQKRYFFNNAIPPVVAQMPGADEETVTRAEKSWKQKFGGYNNQDKVAFLNWEAKFQILKETYKEMDFVESRKYLRDVSNQHFNIPPEIFGILENSNRSTIDAAYYLYTKNVLRKELKFIDDTINKQLLPDFYQDTKINTYFMHSNVVPEDEEFILKKSTEGLINGGITVDEWRIANGKEPLPNEKGQILYTPLNMIPTPLSEGAVNTYNEHQERDDPKEKPNEENEENEEKKGYKKKIKILNDKQKLSFWKLFDRYALKTEKKFDSNMKRYFQTQQDKVNKSITKENKKAPEESIENIINWDEETKLLAKQLNPLYLESLKAGLAYANEFGLDISFDIVNEDFTKWIDKEGLKRAKGINQTTQKKLSKTLSEGITQGESIPKLRDRISNVYDEAKVTRALLIAITETVTTVNYGALQGFKKAGVKKKEWMTAGDNRVRPEHKLLDGEIVQINKDFSNGLYHPSEPNCRCTILPVID